MRTLAVSDANVSVDTTTDTTDVLADAAPRTGRIIDINLRNVAGHGNRADVFYLTTEQMKPLGHNCRDWTDPANIAEIKAIAATVKYDSANRADHIREPLVVLTTPELPVEIEAGETRWRSILLLEGEEYAPGLREPAVVAKGTIRLPCVRGKRERTDLERMADLVTHVGRRPKDLEIAALFQRMLDSGQTQVEIAGAIHRAQTYVSQMLALLKVDPQIRSAMVAGLIASTTVINTYRDLREQPAAATKLLLEEIGKVEAAEKIEAEKAAGTFVAPKSGRGKRQAAYKAPKRRKVTQRQVHEAAGVSPLLTRAPRAHTAVNFATLLAALKYEASYSASEKTRENLNTALKTLGMHPEPCLVDANGDELPNAAEIKAEHEKNVKRRQDDDGEETVADAETDAETDADTDAETPPVEQPVAEQPVAEKEPVAA
jgi:hypothetical protein